MKTIALLCACLLLHGCINDLKDIDTLEVETGEAEYAVALLNGTVTIQDALDNFDTGGYLDIDGNNLINIVYTTGELLSVSGEEIVQIENFQIPVSDTLVQIPIADLDLPFDIDFFTIKQGNLKVDFASSHSEDLDVLISITNLTKNGEILEIPLTVDFTGSTPVDVNEIIPLEDYKLDFQSDEIQIQYVATNEQGERKNLDIVLLEFEDLDYKLVQGYFGQYAFDLPSDSIVIDLFKNSVAGQIYVEDPQVDIIVKNSFGIPIFFRADQFIAETEQSGNLVFESILDQGVNFNYPSVNEVGLTETTNLLFNRDNSNLADVINERPKALKYQLMASSNPDANPDIRGFVLDTSRFTVGVELALPLRLRVKDFTLEETSEFDVSIFDELKEAEFKLLIENDLPIETGVQLYFKDADGLILDSLFDIETTLIPASMVNSDGVVIEQGFGEKIISFDENRIANINRSTQITIKGVFSTANAGATSTGFYTNYGITFKLGVKAKF